MPVVLKRRLVFHGALVVLIGMLSGIPLSLVLLDYMQGTAGDWKLAHMQGLMNGLLLLVIASVSHLLILSDRQYKYLFWMSILTAYGNAFYGWLRGFSGERGLDFTPPLANQVAAILAGFPVLFSFIALSMVAYGAYRRLEE